MNTAALPNRVCALRDFASIARWLADEPRQPRIPFDDVLADAAVARLDRQFWEN